MMALSGPVTSTIMDHHFNVDSLLLGHHESCEGCFLTHQNFITLIMCVVDGAKEELHLVLMYTLSLFHVFGYNGGDAKVQFQRDAQGHGKHVHASLITTYGNARQVRVVEQI